MSYQAEVDFAKELAQEAGKIMRRYFKAEDIGTEWKQDNTPLTVADTTINDLVIEQVKQNFPEHGVIGEEASLNQDGAYVWVVDPVDGTVPFSLGIPTSMFSLALVSKKDGQPVVAVVYDPVLDHLYEAVKGQGAFLNGIKLNASQTKSLKRQYIALEGGLEKGEAGFDGFMPGKCGDLIREQGAKYFTGRSYIYYAIKVASGELVGSLFGYGSPWDAAAVSLIATEAGGISTDLNGEVRRYDEFGKGHILAANKDVLEILTDIVKLSKP